MVTEFRSQMIGTVRNGPSLSLWRPSHTVEPAEQLQAAKRQRAQKKYEANEN